MVNRRTSRHQRVSANLKEQRPTVAPARQPFSGTYVPYRRCACGGRAYVSRQDAKTVKREMARKYGRDVVANTAQVYRCDVDDRSWHVGATPATEGETS